MSVNWDSDHLVRQVLGAARETMEATVLKIGQEVKREMGEEAANLTFDFKKSNDEATADDKARLGTLEINGVPIGVAERFHARVFERLAQL